MEAPHVVVLGAGPGGASAALWCASLGLRVTVLERAGHLGGQLHAISHPIDNLPGLPGALGDALAEAVAAQLAAAGVEVRYGHAGSLHPDALRVLTDADGVALTLEAEAVVVATGTRRRALGVPGEAELRGRGVEHNVGRRAATHAGQDVVVVGGGDDAFEHALLLAPHARTVTVVHRGERSTARPALAEPARAYANVTLRPGTVVEGIEGSARVAGVRLRTREGTVRLPADAVYVCVGPRPNTEGLAGVATHPSGYVRVDRLQRTSRPGIYAVGDVCCPEAPTVATATGQGATAAKVLRAALAGVAPPTPAEPFAVEPRPAEPFAVEPRPAEPFALEPARPADRLAITGLTLPARIGVYPRERRRTQTLSFEIEFEVSAATAAPADALPATIDYAAAADAIAGVLASQHFNLIETVAETVAGALLARFAAPRVRVRVTKPGVPQRQSSASIEVVRSRRP